MHGYMILQLASNFKLIFQRNIVKYARVRAPGISYEQGGGGVLSISLAKDIGGLLNERGLLDERLRYI